METMSIGLPESMKEFVLEQVSQGDFSSASEYMHVLIRADQRRKQREALEAEVLKGLDSGPSTPMTLADWDAIREEVRNRHAKCEQA